MDDMLKAYIVKECPWMRLDEIVKPYFDVTTHEICYKYLGFKDWISVDDFVDLLEFAYSWEKK